MIYLFETVTLVAVSILIVLGIALYVTWTSAPGSGEKKNERDDKNRK